MPRMNQSNTKKLTVYRNILQWKERLLINTVQDLKLRSSGLFHGVQAGGAGVGVTHNRVQAADVAIESQNDVEVLAGILCVLVRCCGRRQIIQTLAQILKQLLTLIYDRIINLTTC